MDIADMSDDRIEFERANSIRSVQSRLDDGKDQVVVMAESGEQMIICVDCDLPIPSERIEAKPNAVRCIYCQMAFEKGIN